MFSSQIARRLGLAMLVLVALAAKQPLHAADGAAAAGGPTAADETTAAGKMMRAISWRLHKRDFTYFGRTSAYTCSSMASKVRSLLLLFGARKDLKVSTSGCPFGDDSPSDMISVRLEFYAPAYDDDLTPPAERGPLTSGYWVPVEIAENRPSGMGRGECEIVEHLKPIISQSFTLRNLEYRTTCVPRQIRLGDYRVRGEVLKSAN
jgi:hypothetical protein